jgi:hypothetical protein
MYIHNLYAQLATPEFDFINFYIFLSFNKGNNTR